MRPKVQLQNQSTTERTIREFCLLLRPGRHAINNDDLVKKDRCKDGKVSKVFLKLPDICLKFGKSEVDGLLKHIIDDG